jgi:SAM-dependent MidA family methyltransferase
LFFPVTALEKILREQIAAAPGGSLPFASVMERALYHPEHGYYGPGPRRIGRGGDFFTSVSTGPLFGKLLAMLAHREWERLGQPADFALIEQGAHDGQLAADILTALDIPGAHYLLLEPNPRYREVQRQRLGDRVTWIESLDEAPAHAFYLSNELPDAFPVHLVRWDGQNWLELHVDAALNLIPATPSSPELAAETEKLPRDLDPGHTMEIPLAMLDWVKVFSQAPFRGSVFIADYGLDAEEFLTRPTGTLRRYRQHQTDDQILADLGESDLTTSINFTRLIAEAESHGLRVADYDHQGRFLTRLATPWLASLEGRGLDAATFRQFQSLTHPAIMGRSFRCLLMEKA